MKYIRLDIVTEREKLETLTSKLMDLGIFSVEIKDNLDVAQVLEKENEYEYDYVNSEIIELDPSVKPLVTCYIGEEIPEDEREAVIMEIKKDYPETVVDLVDDADWKDTYKDHFKTVVLNDDIVIVPTWEEETFDPEMWGGRKPVFLDPGMAFGTGRHETTAMCAELMSEYGCEGKSVLDVGTGSGILAIAAHYMGAAKITAVDIDPVAVNIAKENTVNNHCEHAIEIIEGDLVEDVHGTYDVVVGNLFAEFVIDLSGSVPAKMNEDGVLIASGILLEKKDLVIEGIAEHGFSVIKTIERGEWCALAAKLK